MVVFGLFLSVPLAYSLSNEKHDISSFPPIPNIAGAALVIMANNAEENDQISFVSALQHTIMDGALF